MPGSADQIETSQDSGRRFHVVSSFFHDQLEVCAVLLSNAPENLAEQTSNATVSTDQLADLWRCDLNNKAGSTLNRNLRYFHSISVCHHGADKK